MASMFADYRQNGIDMHNAYIVQGTDNIEQAVNHLFQALTAQGLDIQSICVCPHAKTLDEIMAAAESGLQPGTLCFAFT